MNKEDLHKKVAPCGLVCHTCAAAERGVIQQHAREMLKFLESFDMYAEMLSAHEVRLKKYTDFREVLQLFGEASCKGCRDGVCKFPGCEISPCTKEKAVDFCFECESFPCDKADFEPLLKVKWLKANQRMKEIGVEAFFHEAKEKSHYS